MAVVTVQCPYCAQSYSVVDSLIGRKARCKGCGQTFALSPSGEIPATQPASGVGSTQPASSVGSTQPASTGGSTQQASGIPSTLTSEPSPTTLAQMFPVPETIARFVIKQRLGSGAFGTVYRATDPVLGRDVALKVPQPGLLESASAAERFLREARAAAQLRHPHIIALFETGIDRGDYYIATEYIDGTTLSDAVDPAGIDPRRAAEIIAALAEALQFAHAQGIVHRDVKPANVMLDKAGLPHLMDFGLARFEGASGEKLTRDGTILGTPAYMAPEQATASGTESSAPSDQYSLGATFYELLTGRTPFSGPPEIVIFNLAHRDPPPPRGLKPELPPELETICLKAMARAPGERYQSCKDLADDLRRWLRDEPIVGRRPGMVAKIGQWARRERKLASLVAGVVIGLLALAGWAATVALRPAATASQVRHDPSGAGEQTSPLSSIPSPPTTASHREPTDRPTPSSLDRPTPDTVKTSDPVPDAVPRTAGRVDVVQKTPSKPGPPAPTELPKPPPKPDPFQNWTYEQRVRAAYEACKSGKRDRANDLLDSCPHQARGWEWSYCRRLSQFHPTTLPGHSGDVLCLAFSPDGKRLVSGGQDRTVRLWDGQAPITPPLVGHSRPVTHVAFTADGSRIISLSADGFINEREVPSGKLIKPNHITLQGMTAFDLSQDGKWIAAGTNTGRIIVCDSASGQEDVAAAQERSNVILSVAFSPDGLNILSHTHDAWTILHRRRTVLVSPVRRRVGNHRVMQRPEVETDVEWIPKKSSNTKKADNPTFEQMAASPDGRYVAAAAGNTISVYDRESGKFLLKRQVHPSRISALAFSHDSKYLATDGDDNTVQVLETTSGKWRTSLQAHSSGLTCIRFDKDDRRLAGSSRDGNIYVWPLGEGVAEKTVDLSGGKPGEKPERWEGVFSADSRRMFLKNTDGAGKASSLWSWYAETGQPTHKLDGIIGTSADLTKVVSIAAGRLTIHDTATATPPRHLRLDSSSFSADRAGGSVSAETVILDDHRYGVLIQRNRGAADANYSLGVWDETSGKWLWGLNRHAGTASMLGGVAVHASVPPGSSAASWDGIIYRPDASSIAALSARDGSAVMTQPGTSYQICPQGGLVAVFSGGGDDRGSVRSLEQPRKTVVDFVGNHIAFDPSGKRLATWGGQTKTVNIHHLATGQKQYDLASSDGDVAFTPDGERLIARKGRSLLIYEAATGNQTLELPESTGTPVFSPDGLKLACVGEKLTIRYANPPRSSPAPR